MMVALLVLIQYLYLVGVGYVISLLVHRIKGITLFDRIMIVVVGLMVGGCGFILLQVFLSTLNWE